ncbi:DUF2147 domain-containing protein [Mariluticola halotolerans]|uniref:DUF2147 domain-containing protein n=1 Tax=Mariluticola halotolerans TaxID=2909283 RepID=UPI0026E380C2|nr:DUF2147 domain-containing protein [Mariluticola halotolerans]UJQ95171.1 DUF2147 domain-containing protein [Mariluticola halotolerans]
MKLSKIITTAILLSGLTAMPVQADELTPYGTWQTKGGESRYEVMPCGETKICAKLTWLRADARTEENLQYLNKYVVKGAVASAPNKWRGTVHYDGQKIGGSVTLVNQNALRLQGCQLIFCKSLEFKRI